MKKTKIIYLAPDKIKRDSNQPRNIISDVRVGEMAKNILERGIINPIEIDKNNKIVTGEMRWRSAKKAGLKEVPCTYVDIPKKDLLFHQVSENVHNETMNDMDTAVALDRLLEQITVSPGDTLRTYQGGSKDEGLSELSRKLGKSRAYIGEHLKLLGRSEKFVKAVEEGKLAYTHGRALDRVEDEKTKKKLENKLIKDGDNISRDTGQKMASAIERFPGKVDEILEIDTNQNTNKILHELEEVAPSGLKEADKYFENGEGILKHMKTLQSQMAKHPFNQLELNKEEIAREGTKLLDALVKYLGGKEVSKTIKKNIIEG